MYSYKQQILYSHLQNTNKKIYDNKNGSDVLKDSEKCAEKDIIT